jgi:hypothetical protein
MAKINISILLFLFFASCSSNLPSEKVKAEIPILTQQVLAASDSSTIICTDLDCRGSYSGPEFIGTSDVAHQFSNQMSAKVGDQLKALYQTGKYVKVDFSKIEMSTEGMGSGTVHYSLVIPFKKVDNKCQAFTSFDHVGGWDHSPELKKRKLQLQTELMPGEKLEISKLQKTPEGLQEHWIQWKNKDVQVECTSK